VPKNIETDWHSTKLLQKQKGCSYFGTVHMSTYSGFFAQCSLKKLTLETIATMLLSLSLARNALTSSL